MIIAPVGALVAIGGAVLRVIGLNPQSIETHGTGRAIVTPTLYGNDIQPTGVDPEETTIEALTMPQAFGGLDAYALLKIHKDMQTPVPYIRLGSNFLGNVLSGRVLVTDLTISEERISPIDGRGRQTKVTVTLLHIDGPLGWLSGIL